MVHAHTLVQFQRAYILLEPPNIKKSFGSNSNHLLEVDFN